MDFNGDGVVGPVCWYNGKGVVDGATKKFKFVT